MKGLRVAGAKTLEQDNAYLEAEFIVWWNHTIAVVPASSDDAHRPLAHLLQFATQSGGNLLIPHKAMPPAAKS